MPALYKLFRMIDFLSLIFFFFFYFGKIYNIKFSMLSVQFNCMESIHSAR